MINQLNIALNELNNNELYYKQFNSQNNWGDTNWMKDFILKLLNVSLNNPNYYVVLLK